MHFRPGHLFDCRMVRSLRNEHMSLFKCAAFLADGQLLSVGMHSGEVWT